MKYPDLGWKDNQPFNNDYNDIYFSSAGGYEEALHVYLHANGYPQRWQGQDRTVIAEAGFGAGLNFCVTAKQFIETTDNSQYLYYFAFEKHPLSKAEIQRCLGCWPELGEISAELVSKYPVRMPGSWLLSLCKNRVSLLLFFDDISDALPGLNAEVDAWYLDGFSPRYNPDMWSRDIIAKIKNRAHAASTFSTYSVNGEFRRVMSEYCLEVSVTKGFAQKKEMLRGRIGSPGRVDCKSPWYQMPTVHARNKTVSVIGSGIAGLTTAYAFLQRGWHVTLIDKYDHVAGGASGNQAALVMPKISRDWNDYSRFMASAFLYAIHKYSDLNNLLQGNTWHQTGVLQLSDDDRLQDLERCVDPDKFLAACVANHEASNLCGKPVEKGGIYYPLAGWLSAGDFCRQLYAHINTSVEFIHSQEVTALKCADPGWNVYSGNTQLVHSDVVVLANSLSSKQYEQTCWIPLTGVRGMLNDMTTGNHASELNCPVCDNGYVIPRGENTCTVGATYERCDSDTVSNENVCDDFEKWGQASNVKVFKQLYGDRQAEIKAGRVSHRCATPDRWPVVGPVADMNSFAEDYSDLHMGRTRISYPSGKYQPGLFMNSGHGSHGFVTAFLCADYLLDICENGPLRVSEKTRDALNPARFLVRKLKRGLPLAGEYKRPCIH